MTMTKCFGTGSGHASSDCPVVMLLLSQASERFGGEGDRKGQGGVKKECQRQGGYREKNEEVKGYPL